MVLFDMIGALLKVFVVALVGFLLWLIIGIAVVTWRVCKAIVRLTIALLQAIGRAVTP